MKGAKLLKQLYIASAVLFCIGMTGCRDKMDDIYKGGGEEPEKVPNDFDYSTSKSVKVNFKYDVPTGFRAYFEMYTACPVSLDEDLNYVKNQALLPIAGGYTDENGSFSLTLDIASFVEDIYLYSPQAGVSTLLHSKIVGNTAGTFEKYTPERITAKAVARAGIEGDKLTTGEGFVNWPAWKYGTSIKPIIGKVTSVEDISITEKMQSEINNSIETTVANTSAAEASRFRNDITLRENAEIKLYYFSHGESERSNSLTYYTRLPNESVDKDPVYYLKNKAIMAFDGLSRENEKDGVQLKFETEGKDWVNNFPKGTAISFALLVDRKLEDFRNVVFSYRTYNGYDITNETGKNTQRRNVPHMGVFKLSNNGEEKAYVVLCFEDYPWSDGKLANLARKQTFNDDVFIMEVNPASALPDDIEEPTEEGDKNEYDHFYMNSGIWAFEDNWPKNGDYDMNDIVVSFIRTMYCDKVNNVVSLTDKMQFLNNGATYSNAFGYVLGGGVQGSNIKSIDMKSSPKSSYSQNLGLDKDLEDATIMLFDNGKNVDKNAIFETHVEFNSPVDYLYFLKNFGTPVNPFIVVNGTTESPRTEVHLPKYPPTKKNNNALFGTENDCSDVASNNYYISDKENNYPFAIELIGSGSSGTTDPEGNKVTIPDFTTSPEGVAIDESYPSFVEWVKSGGKTNPDWYLHPKK